jgi:MarR family 2-MHQ and catechol resistance regulon transcriptional repressor
MTEFCELISLLNHAQQCITKEIEDSLKDFGLSLPKYNILRTLAENGGRVPFSILVERLGCVRSNITGLVDRLQEDGLVRRVDHPEDRRMLFAELTDKGNSLIAEAQPVHAASIERAFGNLTGDQRETLEGLLRRLT